MLTLLDYIVKVRIVKDCPISRYVSNGIRTKHIWFGIRVTCLESTNILVLILNRERVALISASTDYRNEAVVQACRVPCNAGYSLPEKMCFAVLCDAVRLAATLSPAGALVYTAPKFLATEICPCTGGAVTRSSTSVQNDP